jgi:hypothetical protein
MFQIRWGIVSEKLPVSWGNDSEKSHGGTAFLRRLVASLPRDARVINVDWNETSEFGPPPRQRVPRTRFLRDAHRAGLRLVTARTILPHQYFLILRRAR